MRTDSTGQGWLERQVTFMTTQIREAAAADPVKPYSNAQMESAFGGMLEFARQRPEFVLRELGVQSTVDSVRR